MKLPNGKVLWFSIHKDRRSLPTPEKAVGTQEDQEKETGGQFMSALVQEQG